MLTTTISLLIAVTYLLVTLAYTCDISVNVIAQTDGPIYARFKFHNGTKSKIYHLRRKDDKKTLRIKDSVCNLQPTILRTYQKHPGPGVKSFGKTSAFIEGVGSANYLVYRDSAPRMGMRVGVTCAFGGCTAVGR
ncbi:unnamed protein product [Cylicocyclus nassatus]|uniref:Secreted protein n=1 Tax=Cylicocyclus nassatus TaxID=53992 RepID=A0AA36H248_CYLNA|nr:unnamed protein product [Cylicocyclus nassatus]